MATATIKISFTVNIDTTAWAALSGVDLEDVPTDVNDVAADLFADYVSTYSLAPRRKYT